MSDARRIPLRLGSVMTAFWMTMPVPPVALMPSAPAASMATFRTTRPPSPLGGVATMPVLVAPRHVMPSRVTLPRVMRTHPPLVSSVMPIPEITAPDAGSPAMVRLRWVTAKSP